MNENTEIRCPNCNSNQLTANKKGFSGKKAVGGALLTGGIGLLAGTLGSNKVIITCLACGHKFKPGQGKIISVSQIQSQSSVDSVDQPTSTTNIDSIDRRILEISQHQGKLAAIKFCKEAKGWNLTMSKDYVDNLTAANGITGKKEGCFIATACYGDYNAKEVLLLRNYRDKVLQPNPLGRLFIKLYYLLSPAFANAIARSDKAKRFIRKHLLKYIVAKVQQRESSK